MVHVPQNQVIIDNNSTNLIPEVPAEGAGDSPAPATKHAPAAGGMFAAINALIGYIASILKMEGVCTNIVTTISSALTQEGQEMNEELQIDSANVTAADNNQAGQFDPFDGSQPDYTQGDHAENTAKAGQKFQQDQLKWQNDMAPNNRKSDQWTSTVSNMSSSTSTGYQMLSNMLSEKSAQTSR